MYIISVYACMYICIDIYIYNTYMYHCITIYHYMTHTDMFEFSRLSNHMQRCGLEVIQAGSRSLAQRRNSVAGRRASVND